MNEIVVNSIDITETSTPNDQSAELVTDTLYVGMSDEEFKTSSDNRITRALKDMEEFGLKKKSATNTKYWLGEQIDASSLRDDLEKGVDNAIFRNMETFIPIANARTPELSGTAAYKNQKTRSYASDVVRSLQSEWEVHQVMQPKVSRAIRNHQMNYIAIFQYGRDEESDCFWTEEILATDMVISKDGSFLAKYIKDETLGDVLKKFPEKKKDILKGLGWITDTEPTKTMLDSPYHYVEVWTDEIVGWKSDTCVLGIKKNPHFDYEGREMEMPTGEVEQIMDPTTGAVSQKPKMEAKKVYYNHFKRPKKPFLFITYFNRGVHIWDDTTLIEQGIGPQDWVNKRKRQIGANADSTNGHWVSSGDFISKEEFDKIEGGIDERIWLQNGKPADGITKVYGGSLADFVYSDLQDSRAVLDNLMGTHATTRGEASGNNTATQDIMQKDQDYGRVDGYVRDGLEQFAKEWYEAMYHMYLVYNVDEKSIAIPEDDDFETDNVLFSRDRVPLISRKNGELIPVPLLLRVKQGSTLPRDEVTQAAMAEKMKDTLAPIDYYKMLSMPNPRELYKNSLIHQTDPFYFFKDDPDIQAMLQEQAMKAQQQAMAAAAAAGGGMTAAGSGQGMTPPPAATTEMESEPSDQGVANAMRAVMEEQGIDPAALEG